MRKAEGKTVSMRRLGSKEQQILPLPEAVQHLTHEATPRFVRGKLKGEKKMSPRYTQEDFAAELEIMLNEARHDGVNPVRIVAGDLHKRVIKEKGVGRVVSACSAMRKRARQLNSKGQECGKLIHEPPSGNSTTTQYEYTF